MSMSDCPLMSGRAYSFAYPRHNYEFVPKSFETRRVLINRVQDMRETPVPQQIREENPLLIRGRWLVTGIDLHKKAERSFYVESMSDVREIELDHSKHVEIWMVGDLQFDSFRQAEAAASAKARHQTTPVKISVVRTSEADLRTVKLIGGQSRRVPRPTFQRKLA